MDPRTITPPRDEPIIGPDTQYIPDADTRITGWFESKGINIDGIIREHNRVSIPIEEDAIFMRSLKDQFPSPLHPAAISPTINKFLQRFKDQREEADRKARETILKVYMMKLPVDLYGDFHSFLRSRSANSTSALIYDLLPHLKSQTDPPRAVDREEEEEGVEEEGRDRAKVRERSVNDDEVQSTSLKPPDRKSKGRQPLKRGRQDDGLRRSAVTKKKAPSSKSRNFPSEGARRSARLQKLDID